MMSSPETIDMPYAMIRLLRTRPYPVAPLPQDLNIKPSDVILDFQNTMPTDP